MRERPVGRLAALTGPRTLLAAGLVLLAVDRLTKWWALEWLSRKGPVVVAPFFHLTYVENTGAAFGMFYGGNAFLIVLALVLTGMLAAWLRKTPPHERATRASLSLVLTGALGNLYDRVRYGYVVDFFDFRVWPVFNVADSCITVGACVLAAALWREDLRRKK